MFLEKYLHSMVYKKIKFPDQSKELKDREENSSVRKQCYKKFYTQIKGKNRSGRPNGESHEKFVVKQGESQLKPRDFT